MANQSTNVMAHLLAQMQGVESLRRQNAAAAQLLATQLQSLAAAEEQAKALAVQRRAQEVAVASAQLATTLARAQPTPHTAAPAPASTSSSAVPSPTPRKTVPEAKREPPPRPAEPVPAHDEVPRCHLHIKVQKTCRLCMAFFEYQDAKNKKLQERKDAAIERLREVTSSKYKNDTGTSTTFSQTDKAPLPNFSHFPNVMLERILKNDHYNMTISNSSVADLKNILFACETCDTESRAHNSLDLEPSAFICSVYRMLSLHLTEGELQSLMNSRSCWIRCAGYMYVRLGIHQDRYWDLLSDALMDDDEFVPFPGREAESMSVGQYVEQLLAKDKYCNLNLPRIPVAQRKSINKRLVLYGQFRRRYDANLEVMERFKDAGVKVEVCNHDGEWAPAETTGVQHTPGRLNTVQVKLASGREQHVSIGMIIVPGKSAGMQDLTKSRGRSAQELLDRYQEQQRDSAVASGKDYCKSSGRHTIHAGGQTFICGEKRGRDREDEIEAAAALTRDAKRSTPSLEQEMKMAAIMEKYCASNRASAQSRSQNQDGIEGPERLRLG
mmetsp:Transcript_17476/g.34103  ORF Transcript_17476/g.34103 Transcript_17476/m.34103 type:complete len:554 (+) Transcript_17476:65-1726(+)